MLGDRISGRFCHGSNLNVIGRRATRHGEPYDHSRARRTVWLPMNAEMWAWSIHLFSRRKSETTAPSSFAASKNELHAREGETEE